MLQLFLSALFDRQPRMKVETAKKFKLNYSGNSVPPIVLMGEPLFYF